MEIKIQDRLLIKMVEILNQIRKNTEELVLLSKGERNMKPKIDMELVELLKQVKTLNAIERDSSVIMNMLEENK